MTVLWLVNQLVEHETDAEKWWKNPVGFNLLDQGDEFSLGGPPLGWERLPMHEGD